MKSIKKKFLVLILGCVLLSALAIGGAGVWNTARVVDDGSSRILNLLCREKAEEINSLLESIEQSVNTIYHFAESQMDDKERLWSDRAYLEQKIERIKEVSLNAAENTASAVAVYLRFEPELTTPIEGFFLTRDEPGASLTSHEITDLTKYDPDDMGRVGWYFLPRKHGKPMWMPPYMNENLGIQMISYVIPLYQEERFIGVLGMDVDLELLENSVLSVEIYESGYGVLTDQKGNLYVHRDLTREMDPEPFRAVMQEALHIPEGETGKERLLTYDWKGQKKKMAWQTLNNDMIFVVTAPASEIDISKTRLLQQSLLSLLLVLAVSVLLTIRVTRHITGPLLHLTEAARRIAAGDLTVQIQFDSQDEIGILAESFQQTVSHLEHYIGYINNLAYRDSLTGISNKTAYQAAVTRLEERLATGQLEFAVVVMDINNLKSINDNYGHEVGDELIQSAAAIMQRSFGENVLYRIGGDEFAVILEPPQTEQLTRYLGNLEQEMQTFNIGTEDHDRKVLIACGSAQYEPEKDKTVSDVFRRADAVMYESKARMKKPKEEG